MDPNANLEELLLLAMKHRDERWAELLMALDEWIISGGFLPERWTDAKM